MDTAGKLTELIPDRKLLSPDFEGYKLSLKHIPVCTKNVEGVDYVEASDDQYSFLHQKEFAFHNHLYVDIWNTSSIYYINNKRKIIRVDIGSENSQVLNDGVEVWEVVEMNPRVPGDYNMSLCFSSKDTALVCDGAGNLHLLNTFSRATPNPWKVVHSELLEGEGAKCKLVDARYCEAPSMVVCLLSCVLQQPGASSFQTVIQIVSLKHDENGGWMMGSRQELRGPGSVEYAALEPSCEAMYLAADVAFSILSTSEEQNCKGKAAENGEEEIKYHWQQSLEDVKVWFDLDTEEGEASKNDVQVASKNLALTALYKGIVLLDTKLFKPVDADLTTWTLQGKRLEIVLTKGNEGGMWERLTEEVSNRGKEIVDEALMAEIHSRLAHLTSETQAEDGSMMLNSGQMEECDAFEGASRLLARIDLSNLQVTDKAMLGGQQWLLNLRVGPEEPPAFCLRNDVDGCVWIPGKTPQHVATFLAFGYIQASKTDKKFTIAPQDMSYVAIVDVSGRVMLYRKGISVSGDLRNRKTGKKVEQIANQHLVSLQPESGHRVMGALALEEYLVVLTSGKLYALTIQD